MTKKLLLLSIIFFFRGIYGCDCFDKDADARNHSIVVTTVGSELFGGRLVEKNRQRSIYFHESILPTIPKEIYYGEEKIDTQALIGLCFAGNGYFSKIPNEWPDFKNLKMLGLDATGVTEIGPYQLQGLSSLEDLSLQGLTGLKVRKGGFAISNLKKLDLRETTFTFVDTGAFEFHKTIPRIRFTEDKYGVDLLVSAMQKSKGIQPKVWPDGYKTPMNLIVYSKKIRDNLVRASGTTSVSKRRKTGDKD